jgi:hypothetical protein
MSLLTKLNLWGKAVALKRVSDEEIITAMKRFGSTKLAAEFVGMSVRGFGTRKAKIQMERGIPLPAYCAPQESKRNTYIPDNRRVIEHTVDNGHIFIASDCHYWPEESTIAHKAFVKLITEFKPKTIVLNGDVFDGARISRHATLMGTNPPTPKQEIEACQDRLDEIANASKNAVKLFTYGNHDIRLFNYIAQNAPELSEFSDLFSYFPGWHTGWRIDVNGSVIIKHRYHNGIHSTWNNALKSGRSIITGHLHQLKITPFSDYDGRRWGVDSGTLAEPYSDQFTYTEMNPVNWCSGFAVLTFENGKLLPPELCEVIGGIAYFRGQRV